MEGIRCCKDNRFQLLPSFQYSVLDAATVTAPMARGVEDEEAVGRVLGRGLAHPRFSIFWHSHRCWHPALLFRLLVTIII